MGKRKYRTELKLEIIKGIKVGKYSVDRASELYAIEGSVIRKWVTMYERHGLGGIERQYGKYSADFKESVIKDMKENQLSYRETARKYNISMHTTIIQWERIYMEEGYEGLSKQRKGRASQREGILKGRNPIFKKGDEEDLLAEVQRLRMENEYLKKLNALVRSKEE